MLAAGVKTIAFASSVVVADYTHLASVATGAVVLGGLFTLGMMKSVAWAWREEKIAAVEKAERLAEEAASEKTARLTEAASAAGEREALRARVEILEKQTNFSEYAQQSSAEHREIVVTLQSVQQAVMQMTAAVEFIAKQTFPTNIDEGATP